MNRCGLSPYLRGILAPLQPPDTPPRFIPVPTGNTGGWLPPPDARPVYPRTYGEYI